jgi:tRNA pseudouridine55 synthase
MGRRRSEEAPGASGFLVVDKPAGWTSHDVVAAARRWLGTRRVGHLGTLDPLATGVLPLAVRDATKLVPFLADAAKRYRTRVRLGVETDSYDADGRETRRHTGALPDEAAVRSALARFVGEIEQVPPMFSAVKQRGVPLYRLARRGEEVERASRRVRIDALALLAYAPPDLELDVACTAGTYVRVLAHDLGRALGCGAHVVALHRTASGPFGAEAAHGVAELDAAAEAGRADELLVPPLAVLGLPVVALGVDAARRVAHGGEIAAPTGAVASPGTRVAAVDEHGGLLAILETAPGRRLRPLRVLRGAVAAPGPL